MEANRRCHRPWVPPPRSPWTPARLAAAAPAARHVRPGAGCGDAGAVYVDLGEFAGQARPGAGRGDDRLVHGVHLGLRHINSCTLAAQLRQVSGREEEEELLALLRDGHGAVYDSSGNLARQVRAGAGRGEAIVAALGDPSPGAQSGAVGTLAERLGGLLPVAGIAASSVAVTGLAAGTTPPAAGFSFFALLLGALSLVTIHVLRA